MEKGRFSRPIRQFGSFGRASFDRTLPPRLCWTMLRSTSTRKPLDIRSPSQSTSIEAICTRQKRPRPRNVSILALCMLSCLRRQSNFAGVALVSRLTQTAGALGSTANVQFARDFSFRQVKSGNIVLLGTRQSNPWIQPFDSSLALRWKFDPALGINYPIDRTAGSAELNKFQPDEEGTSHDGYAGIAFLPNLGGTGSVLIVSGSGGAALGAALDFLNDEASMSQLRARLNPKAKDVFPYFEVLLKVAKGGSLPKFTTIVLCRSPQPIPQDVQTVSAELHR